MDDTQRLTFLSGKETRAYRYMGCHREQKDGKAGYAFRVWAPNAVSVAVAGSFNDWSVQALPMTRLDGGIFETFTVHAREGDEYKYYIVSQNGDAVWKADPYGVLCGTLPDTASVIYSLHGYQWQDGAYRRAQARKKLMQNPINIYEIHPGSWRKKEDGGYYTYAELADELVPYVREMGYTHIELMPVSEHPYLPSWGYQITGYYAPTSRYGTPKDLMKLVDVCHAAGIGVLMDWVPGHFPKDEQGLYEFDGSCCYELSDPLMNEHPQWTTRLFDYGKPEVLSFLISNAVYWIEEYHLDGLRVDAVASMLYLDFGRTEWHPNQFGGNLNLEATAFLRAVNRTVGALRTNLIMAAEESTTFPHVTGFADDGLGFTLKWNMGWMNDMLSYMELDPIYRKHYHDKLTFTMTYTYSEQFLLPLSHDEVVHGKHSLIEKMPGYYDDKFSNLRTFFGFQMSHPGKKLNFMGNEFAQFIEWDEKKQLDWFLLDYDRHRQMQQWVRDLNHFYLEQRPFWQNDSDWGGFQWIEANDRDFSVVAYRRIDRKGKEIIVVCNFCPVLREHYRLGLPKKGCYLPKLCSDAIFYGGTGVPLETVRTEPVPSHGQTQSAEFTIPPLSVTFYTQE
ncbi:MAG: 1,4-alpha-glucan branching protein GlgB [Oscillospiraceae bacterium]|nr:1,4-alpha-glucan branching protein GlgB [Oscillospiraceae bacterium]